MYLLIQEHIFELVACGIRTLNVCGRISEIKISKIRTVAIASYATLYGGLNTTKFPHPN